MKYLARNTDTNVIDMMYEMPINASPPLEIVKVSDEDWQLDMLNSIFIDVNNYKPTPAGRREYWWESNGTDWVDTRDNAKVWKNLRTKRDGELAQCDWTQLGDVTLTSLKKGLWTTYRTQLRDVPQNNSDPRAAEKALEDAIRDDKPTS